MLYRKMPNGDELSALGFGLMRLPLKDKKIDEERAEAQVTEAIAAGVNYLDTAYIYHEGKSEEFLGKLIAKGSIDRRAVKIADKLPVWLVNSRFDMDKFMDIQLNRLKTDYIDYYLVHSLSSRMKWEQLKKYGIFDFLNGVKKSGKAHQIGFSWHGNCEEFKQLVDDYPWDFCQIQYNIIDENNQAGKEGLEYACKKGLGVIIMEPLRGGTLTDPVPPEVQKIYDTALVRRTPASWALRWVWNHPEVTVVLSGMNEEEHLRQNLADAAEVLPGSMSEEEMQIISQVKEAYKGLLKIPCTGCRYCMPCPAGLDIPMLFDLYNTKKIFKKRDANFFYLMRAGGVADGKKPALASGCKGCRKCERHCPQQIKIRDEMKNVEKEMESIWTRPLIMIIGHVLKVVSWVSKRRK